MNLMTVGAADVHAFVGVGGPYWQDSNGDGVVDSTNPAGAMGIALEDVGFALALMKPVAGGPTYYGLSGRGSASFVGINGFTLDAQEILLEVNQTSDASNAVNFSLLPGGGLSVPTGPATPGVQIGFNDDLLRARGFITLGISDFVHVNGNFALEKGAARTARLTNGGIVDVDMLKIGATGVHAFVGLGGPYWRDTGSAAHPGASGTPDGIIDGHDAPDAVGALGLALGSADLGLVLMKPLAGGNTSYYALKASGSVDLVGLPLLDVSAQELTIEVNKSNDGSPVVDFGGFAGGRLLIPTGVATPEVALNFHAELLRASGLVTLTLHQFIHISGAGCVRAGSGRGRHPDRRHFGQTSRR